MKILADENIAELSHHFAAAGELVTMPGRAIDARALRDVDALLVRSITRVDAKLLADSPCRFVGTATSGIDHVDTAWLRARGIEFAWAKGCNANSVVEYVFSAMAALSCKHDFDWRRLRFGIVGCGEIGGRLVRKLRALGVSCIAHDPFLDESHPLADSLRGLDDVLMQDVISFHTPLTREGPWPTRHMLNEATLGKLAATSILINAARGAVVDNKALLRRLERHPEQLVVLDAWEGEPGIDQALMRKVALATPHIAGYSREGKVNGTRMVAEAFYEYFGLTPAGDLFAPADSLYRMLDVDPGSTSLRQLNQLILNAYDVRSDDHGMQGLLASMSPEKFFDDLRKHYPQRHEFARFGVLASTLAPEVAEQAGSLGFRLVATQS